MSATLQISSRFAALLPWIPDLLPLSLQSSGKGRAYDGGLRGPPKVLARVLKGDDQAKRAYEAAAYAALDRCLPFRITPAFKTVMGETLVLLRFVNTPREPALNLGASMTIFAAEAKPE